MGKAFDHTQPQTCIRCGIVYVQHRKTKYCSQACMYQAAAERIKRKRAAPGYVSGYVHKEKRTYTHKCLCCGVEFEAKNDGRGFYCSRYCQNRHSIGTFICKHCGNPFEAKGKDRTTFCSKSCGAKYMWKEAGHTLKEDRQQTIYTHTCEVCGMEYQNNRKNGRRCSSECRKEAGRQKARDYDRIVRHKPGLPVVCRKCGVSFVPEYRDKRSVFCSVTCAKHYANKHGKYKRKAMILGAYVAPVSATMIYQRDHGICQLCGRKVRVNAKWPNMMCASLDHIIPLSMGGSHEPKNVQLAHFLCNMRKSNGTTERGEQLRIC